MLEKIIRDYFSFTKKERTAVLVLIVLIVIIFLLPYLIPEPALSLNNAELKIIKVQNDRYGTTQQSDADSTQNGSASVPGYEINKEFKNKASPKVELFKFDPNKVSAGDWKRLGLRDKTINTIHNYIARGGRFRRKEDLAKIYGLNESDATRLMPYVSIPDLKEPKEEAVSRTFHEWREGERYQFSKATVARQPVNINEADTSLLIAIPGIGSKLATRILRFREKLGGFYSVEQLSEIYGLQDSVFQKIKPLLTVSNSRLSQLNINSVEIDELKQHPYIRWNLAAAIVEYRKQHGNYKTLGELKNIELVTNEVYLKIAPYLKVDE